MPENLENLQKISKILSLDKIVTNEEVEAILQGIVGILSNFKKSTEALNDETKERVQNLLNYVVDEHSKMVSKMEEHTGEHAKKMTAEMEGKMADMLSQCKDLMEECKMMMPMDGKDADEERVISEVLEKIKLPEYREFVLDEKGEQIVKEINELPTDNDDLKIDAKHIKGLPDLKDNKGKTVFTAIRGPEVKIYDLSAQLDGVTKTFSLPAFRLVFDVRSSSFPYAFRPTTDYTTDGAAMTITFTDQITADATLAAGQTLYILYLTI